MVLVLSFAPLALAQQASREYEQKKKAREAMFDTIVKDLALSPEQQQQITDQRHKETEKSQELRQKIKAVRTELSQELDKEVIDRAKVYSLISELKELYGNRLEKKVEGILSLKDILTPAQFRALNEKTKQFESEKGGWR
jgi:Spy/CpxP family protein refolding chaperone